MHLDALYFETKPCFFFIKITFTFVKLLLQKGNIVFISYMKIFLKTLKNVLSPLSPKISDYIDSRVPVVILMDSLPSL